jgi:hypothetical protein
MPTTVVVKYQMTATITILPASGLVLNLPIRSCKIEYKLNDIPKATFSTPLAILCHATRSIPSIIDDFTVSPNWPLAWKHLLKLNPCAITLQVALMGGGGGSIPVFQGYVYSANASYTNEEVLVEFHVVGRLIEAGFGSVTTGMIHPSSPADFSNANLFLGVPTFQQVLTMQLPVTSIGLLQNMLTGAYFSLFNFGGVVQSYLFILLGSSILTDYAALKLVQYTGFPVLPFVGQGRAAGSLGRMVFILQLNNDAKIFMWVYGYGYSEVLAQSLVGTDVTSWTNATLFARLLDLGATWDFLIAPSYSVDAYIIPNNPISPYYQFTFSPRDYIYMKVSGEVRQDVRGVVLVAESQLPHTGMLLAKETAIAGYYDVAWFNFPDYYNNFMSGSLLVIPAPAWMKGSSLTDMYVQNVQQWLNTFQLNYMQNWMTAWANILTQYWTTLYYRNMTRLGTLIAGSIFHKLAYETRRMIVVMPIINAIKYYGMMPGPGTIAKVLGYNFLRKDDYPDKLAMIGQITAVELEYDINEKKAGVTFSLSHVRGYEEVKDWIITSFPYYGYHPLWVDPPYINTIP